MNFKGKTALVTGAGKGIGRGIARALAEEGAVVAVCGRTLPSLNTVVGEIRTAGGQAFAINADVSAARDVESLVGGVLDRCGRLDILVNNAGVYLTAAVAEMSEEEWDVTIAVDLKGVFLCSRAAARQMIRQRTGRIINITSVAQLRGGTPGHAHYGAAKAGVGAFTKTLARELGPFGITVNCVAPGLIEDTEMGRMSKALMGDSYLATIPLGCLGTVQDVVAAVLFLASDQARYITGETLNVNGGSHMA
ncbi:MAG: SDR family oxidoreductase [Candidatus Rokubacteria bacterium]|nr:SDR family oxidoreductase [Candidatus Rokubacteria bacterium]